MVEWVPIRIPEELYKQIQEVINHNKVWVNEHEFIRDAIREKLAKSEDQPTVLEKSQAKGD
jgi:Arc/MetJ-type ribon-helix-helix transcriptional regulator